MKKVLSAAVLAAMVMIGNGTTPASAQDYQYNSMYWRAEYFRCGYDGQQGADNIAWFHVNNSVVQPTMVATWDPDTKSWNNMTWNPDAHNWYSPSGEGAAVVLPGEGLFIINGNCYDYADNSVTQRHTYKVTYPDVAPRILSEGDNASLPEFNDAEYRGCAEGVSKYYVGDVNGLSPNQYVAVQVQDHNGTWIPNQEAIPSVGGTVEVVVEVNEDGPDCYQDWMNIKNYRVGMIQGDSMGGCESAESGDVNVVTFNGPYNYEGNLWYVSAEHIVDHDSMVEAQYYDRNLGKWRNIESTPVKGRLFESQNQTNPCGRSVQLHTLNNTDQFRLIVK
ncbi:hypothetical protein ACFL16_03095 [Patescibacteria group bacterium]